MTLDDPWASVKAWRARRAKVVHESEPSYDARPDHTRPPRVRLYLAAFDLDGNQLDTEEVDLDGLSAREVVPGLVNRNRQRWLADRFIQAHSRLYGRLGPP